MWQSLLKVLVSSVADLYAWMPRIRSSARAILPIANKTINADQKRVVETLRGD